LKKGEYWGMIDFDGNELIPFKLPHLNMYHNDFTDGLLLVNADSQDKGYCINDKGDILFQYEGRTYMQYAAGYFVEEIRDPSGGDTTMYLTDKD
jgi:hypothetical protein